jgi:tRNA threonylcarbamoyl adenosine modification protein YeaZ
MKCGNILAIEAAIGGGSIAVLSDGRLLDKWHATETIPRSEQLLEIISSLIDSSIDGKEAITGIAVSRGPGSYTGIRIGLAAAMGLGQALGVPVIGASALQAIAYMDDAVSRLVVVPIGRNGLCWQYFAAGTCHDDGLIASGSIDNLIKDLDDVRGLTVVAQSDAYDHILTDGRLASRNVVLTDFGRDIAVAVGIAGPSIDDGLEPLYARDTFISQKIA